MVVENFIMVLKLSRVAFSGGGVQQVFILFHLNGTCQKVARPAKGNSWCMSIMYSVVCDTIFLPFSSRVPVNTSFPPAT